MKLRRIIIAALLTVLGVLAFAPGAFARPGQTTYFEAPRDLYGDAATREATFNTLTGLGVKALRVTMLWHNVAPDADSATKPAFDATDPAAYNWGGYGATIDEAKQKGWQVLITLTGPVPQWATAAKADDVTNPSPAEFQSFATAAAKRFAADTPTWSIWNEPNLPNFLLPQIVGGKFVAGLLYRNLFIAGQAGLAAGGQATAPVLYGELAPVGSAHQRQEPLAFLRDSLCLSKAYKRTASCAKLSFTGLAMHPYRSTLGSVGADDVPIALLPRLEKVLDKAAKAGAILSKRPVYVTEFGVQSFPDHTFGFSYQDQLDFRANGERTAWFDPRVRSFSQYLLRDDLPTPPPTNYLYSGFETGLENSAGKAKPALKAFQLTLSAEAVSKKKVSIWGLVRPATGATKVVLQRGKGSKFTN